MDALFSKADAIRPVAKRRKTSSTKGDHHSKKPSTSKSQGESSSNDHTLNSVAVNTKLPKSLRDSLPQDESLHQYKHIANKKLRAQLTRQSAQSARSKALVKDAELLLAEDAGMVQVEGDMEKTWRVGQSEVVQAAGEEAARGRKEWTLEGGPYRARYTRNGRCVNSTVLLIIVC